jgi:hypothetical protein
LRIQIRYDHTDPDFKNELFLPNIFKVFFFGHFLWQIFDSWRWSNIWLKLKDGFINLYFWKAAF